MTPEWLVSQFSETSGRIEGSTATFGAPFYGDRVLGRVVYGDSLTNHSHCREEDYTVPEPETTQRSGSDYKEVKLINIIMVRRGKCSFTTKVRVAYQKGAHAVLIVDKEDSQLTSKDLRKIIVADDGFGDKIHIPSVLISKEDGRRLINAAKRSQVIVELAWDVPTNHVVSTDMWMSSASQASLKFLKEFSKNRRVLNEVMIFIPHYAVFSMDGSDPAVYNDLCSDETGQYCAEDPDGAGPITGKMVLREDVRQLCIHEVYKKHRTSYDLSKMDPATMPVVEYAEEYWSYIEKFLDRCSLDGSGPQDKFGDDCSEKLMSEVGIDVQKINTCMATTSTKKLKKEREYPAWSPRALRINGWRYSGILDPDLVTRAICSGFIHQPKECKDMIRPRNPFKPYTGATAEGVSFSTLMGWLGGTLLVAFSSLMLYKRYLKKEMRTTLREEVMLEVQAQMGNYSKLSGQ